MQGNVLLGVPLAFTSFGAIVVALRFYVRTRSMFVLGLDDWIMLLAMIIEVVNRTLTTLSTVYDIRVPLTPEDEILALKYNYVALPFQVTVSVSARLSIMIFLIKLFGVHRWFKRFLITLFATLSLLSVVFIPITFCQITPVQAIWDFSLVVTKRWNPNIWLYWACVTQSVYTFSDLAFVMLPVIIIWKLHMPLSQKIGLILLMALSLLAMVMSIMRTVWIVVSYSGDSTLGDYNETAILTLALIEGDMVIIMGCIPALRSIMKLDLPNFGSSISNFFHGTRTKSKPSTSSDSYNSSAPYHDLEMSGRRLGTNDPNDRVQDSEFSFYPNNRSQAKLVGDSEVRRTDEFIIAYEPMGEDGRHNS